MLENVLNNSYDSSNLEKWFEKIYNEVNEYSHYLDIKSIGGVCVDVGANVGAFAAKYSSYFNDILCIEPAEGNLKYAHHILGIKNVKNFHLLRRAVSDKDDQIVKLRPLIFGDKREWDGLGSLGNLSTQIVKINETVEWIDNEIYEEIMSISLDGVFNELKKIGYEKINLLKVDCEGSEYDFLYEKNLINVQYIVMEIHGFLSQEKKEKLINHIFKTHDLIRMSRPQGNFTISFKNKNT